MSDKKRAIELLYAQKEKLDKLLPLAEENGRGNELSVYDNHPADSADLFYEASKDDALSRQRKQEYEEVMHAIEKVNNGTYGFCEETGQPIPPERLLAHPTARVGAVKGNNERQRSLILAPPQSHASPGAHSSLIVNGDAALDGNDMWEALLNTTEDTSYKETGTTDFWVEKAPGYTEEFERYTATGAEGYTGADEIIITSNAGDYGLTEEEWR